jgi:hypothetical protein
LRPRKTGMRRYETPGAGQVRQKSGLARRRGIEPPCLAALAPQAKTQSITGYCGRQGNRIWNSPPHVPVLTWISRGLIGGFGRSEAVSRGRIAVYSGLRWAFGRFGYYDLVSGLSEAAEKVGPLGRRRRKQVPGAKARIDSASGMPGLKSRHTSKHGFSAAYSALKFSMAVFLGLRPRLVYGALSAL